MYSKLSFFCLLVGLINQTIATSHLENEISDSIVFDENTISNFATSAEETTISNDDFEQSTSYFETTDSYDRSRNADMLIYLRKCLKHGNSSILDLDLVQSIQGEIAESSNHVGDSQLSDKTKNEIEAVFDFIIDALNASDSEIAVSFDQAAERFVYIILSGKESDLKQIIHIIAKSSKKLMRVLMTHNEDISELIQSMNNKIVTSAMLKEDPSMSTYLLDLMLSIMRVIDRYEEQDDINEVVEALRSILKQAKKDIMDSQISNDTEIVQSLIQVIDSLADEIFYIFGMDMSNQAKFIAARCMTEDSVTGMFMQTFMIKFRSEIDS